MERIAVNTTIAEILSMKEFKGRVNYLVSSASGDWSSRFKSASLKDIQKKHPTWNADDMVMGLERVVDLHEKGYRVYYPLSRGCFLHLPSDSRKSETFIVLAAGGAYGAVCTFVESLPVAARLNELGYDCFCLNYSTADKACFQIGLMPRPLEDVCNLLRFIEENKDELDVADPFSYVMGGFSAGGHLAALWGTGSLGARRYDCANPKALLLAYPAISMRVIGSPEESEFLRKGLFGVDYTDETLDGYSVDRNIDDAYPPVFFVHAKDDNVVSNENARLMYDSLSAHDIRKKFEEYDTGGHGFGLGSACDAVGWVDRAIEFIEGLD